MIVLLADAQPLLLSVQPFYVNFPIRTHNGLIPQLLNSILSIGERLKLNQSRASEGPHSLNQPGLNNFPILAEILLYVLVSPA